MKPGTLVLGALAVCTALGQTAESAVEKQLAAAALQRASVQRQVESARPYRRPASDIPTEPSCASIPEPTLAPVIESAAKANSVEPKLLRAVIASESAFRPCAVSRAGAQGLMQLMPATAEDLGVEDPFDPKQNIDAGARYLKQLLDKYEGDLPQALGAYNAGPAVVDQSNGIPAFPETRSFVKTVLEKIGITRTGLP